MYSQTPADPIQQQQQQQQTVYVGFPASSFATSGVASGSDVMNTGLPMQYIPIQNYSSPSNAVVAAPPSSSSSSATTAQSVAPATAPIPPPPPPTLAPGQTIFYQCSLCRATFPSREDFDRHAASVHGQPSIQTSNQLGNQASNQAANQPGNLANNQLGNLSSSQPSSQSSDQLMTQLTNQPTKSQEVNDESKGVESKLEGNRNQNGSQLENKVNGIPTVARAANGIDYSPLMTGVGAGAAATSISSQVPSQTVTQWTTAGQLPAISQLSTQLVTQQIPPINQQIHASGLPSAQPAQNIPPTPAMPVMALPTQQSTAQPTAPLQASSSLPSTTSTPIGGKAQVAVTVGAQGAPGASSTVATASTAAATTTVSGGAFSRFSTIDWSNSLGLVSQQSQPLAASQSLPISGRVTPIGRRTPSGQSFLEGAFSPPSHPHPSLASPRPSTPHAQHNLGVNHCNVAGTPGFGMGVPPTTPQSSIFATPTRVTPSVSASPSKSTPSSINAVLNKCSRCARTFTNKRSLRMHFKVVARVNV